MERMSVFFPSAKDIEDAYRQDQARNSKGGDSHGKS